MSFLEQFLKESSVGRSRDPLNSTASGSNSGRPERVSMDSSSAGKGSSLLDNAPNWLVGCIIQKRTYSALDKS